MYLNSHPSVEKGIWEFDWLVFVTSKPQSAQCGQLWQLRDGK